MPKAKAKPKKTTKAAKKKPRTLNCSAQKRIGKPRKKKPAPIDKVEDHEFAIDLFCSIDETVSGDNRYGEAERIIDDEVPKPLRTRGGQLGNNNAEKWTQEVADALGRDLITWLQELPHNIFFEEFLIQIKNLHPNIIGRLRTKFDSFRELLKKAEKIKEIKVIKWALIGKLNPSMAIWVTKTHFGYNEKIKVEHSGKVDSDVDVTAKINYTDMSAEQLAGIVNDTEERSKED